MRVFIKGGVWKNTEDEILKAAVMKYGKNMWARVASLLPRKSAKQVKARWYEWLDPSIKKTEWTRDEEERLLHLAKLMPTQWRTIAPIVGRTAQQCLEHYEKLLNAAAAPEDQYEDGDDPRRLRPGEVDPHPETRPARPDPVDMDEDEKEMLSEARARLVNTRGKKAKRKAREKQLEEARRLASLQKRRELKAAGLNTRTRKKRKREIDYVNEVPFEKVAPAGFYDTSSDDVRMARQRRDPGFIGKNLQQLEARRRDEEERRARQRDKKRVRKLQQQNLPKAIMMENSTHDPANFRKRSRLSMPAPQVSDAELEDIVKHGGAAAAAAVADGTSTAGLLSQRSAMPGATPMRTPRTPAGRNVVMEEARNLRKLASQPTPLMPGASKHAQLALEPGTGYGGVTPAHSVAATPNTLAGGAGAGAGAGDGASAATPARSTMSGSATPMTAAGGGATPLRDDLSINQADVDMWSSGSTRAERARAKAARAALAAKLSALPAPENEVDIVVPDVDNGDNDDEDMLAPDAADLDAAKEAKRKAAHEAEMKRRSAALRHEAQLPRPSAVNPNATAAASMPTQALKQAARAVEDEMVALLRYDAAKYPTRKAKRRRRVPRKEQFSDKELAMAADQVASEEITLRIMHEEELGSAITPQLFERALQQASTSIVFAPTRNDFAHESELSHAELVAARKHELQRLQGQMAKLAKRCSKLEARSQVLTAGYQKRVAAQAESIQQHTAAAEDALLELNCFHRLARDETSAIPSRLAAAEAEARDVEEREQELQARYKQLLAEREALVTALAP